MTTSATQNFLCEEFQEQIPELLALSSDSDPEDHPHARACPDCRQLMRDYATIAEAAQQLHRFGFGTDEWPEST